MLRRVWLAVGLIALSFKAAHALEPVNVVIDSVSSTATIRGIDITTQTATSVIISTSMLFRQVCIQNFDQMAYVACSEHVNVSTITATTDALAGTVVAPTVSSNTVAVPTCFAVPAGGNFYCKSASVTRASQVGVTRKR